VSSPTTPESYIATLEPERQEMISAIRQTVNANIDPGFEEIIDFGMIAWCIPLERYPDTYNGHPLMYAALASQKQYVSLYLMGIYSNPERAEWFQDEYRKSLDRKPNMGKSCIRFRKLGDVPFDLVGQAIRQDSVESYLESVHRALGR
jgi:hypothetical protein